MERMIILLLLFCVSSIQVSGHKCIHDELDYTVETLDLWQDSHSVSTTFEPIRIHADFQGIQRLDDKTIDFIEFELVPTAIEYFEELLSVRRAPKKIILKDTRCYEATVPEYLKTDGVDADLVLMVTADDCIDDPGTIAWAVSCLKDETTRRPFAGQINFCRGYLNFSNEEEKRKQLDTALHEITHVLGFARALFPHFIDPTTLKVRSDFVKREGGKRFITTERVVDVAKRYFNCPNTIGVELAADGTAHWEGNIFGNEMMTPSENDNTMAYSSFTIALLEDSGWYKANYAKAQVFSFGRNRGCSFLSENCINAQTMEPRFEREFCDTQKEKDICLFDGSYIATCPRPRTYGKCPTPRKKGNTCETGTKCFISGIVERAGCHKFQCSTHDYMRKLQVEVNCGFGWSKKVECPVEGGKVRYNCYNGAEEYLLCPPYNQICTSDTDIVRPSIETYLRKY